MVLTRPPDSYLSLPIWANPLGERGLFSLQRWRICTANLASQLEGSQQANPSEAKLGFAVNIFDQTFPEAPWTLSTAAVEALFELRLNTGVPRS